MAEEQTMKLCTECEQILNAENGGPYWLQQVSDKELHGCSLCGKDYRISHVFKYESVKARKKRQAREQYRQQGLPRQKDTRAHWRGSFWDNN